MGLPWTGLVEDLAVKLGVLVGAPDGEDSGPDDAVQDAKEWVTQAVLLAIDAYVLAGPSGVPAWMAQLLPGETNTPDGQAEAFPAQLEGLRMWQLLAAADWRVLQAVLCPDPPEGSDVERPPGQGFGLLRPMVDAPSLVAFAPGERLLKVRSPRLFGLLRDSGLAL